MVWLRASRAHAAHHPRGHAPMPPPMATCAGTTIARRSSTGGRARTPASSGSGSTTSSTTRSFFRSCRPACRSFQTPPTPSSRSERAGLWHCVTPSLLCGLASLFRCLFWTCFNFFIIDHDFFTHVHAIDRVWCNLQRSLARQKQKTKQSRSSKPCIIPAVFSTGAATNGTPFLCACTVAVRYLFGFVPWNCMGKHRGCEKVNGRQAQHHLGQVCSTGLVKKKKVRPPVFWKAAALRHGAWQWRERGWRHGCACALRQRRRARSGELASPTGQRPL